MDYPGMFNIITWALKGRESFVTGGRKKCGRRESKIYVTEGKIREIPSRSPFDVPFLTLRCRDPQGRT